MKFAHFDAVQWGLISVCHQHPSPSHSHLLLQNLGNVTQHLTQQGGTGWIQAEDAFSSAEANCCGIQRAATDSSRNNPG